MNVQDIRDYLAQIAGKEDDADARMVVLLEEIDRQEEEIHQLFEEVQRLRLEVVRQQNQLKGINSRGKAI